MEVFCAAFAVPAVLAFSALLVTILLKHSYRRSQVQGSCQSCTGLHRTKDAVEVKPNCCINELSGTSLSWTLKPGTIEASAMDIAEALKSLPKRHQPRRIALFVEPSPFSHISGYKNRFQNFIKYLREMGDEVIVVTTHKGAPEEFYGAKVIGSWRATTVALSVPQYFKAELKLKSSQTVDITRNSISVPLWWYSKVRLSLALSPRIIWEVARFKPDIIHVTSPGIMVFGALLIAKLLCAPIVMSYHTHIPIYIPKYTFNWLVHPMWSIIKFLHTAADLTLVPSAALAKELEAAGAAAGYKIRLWNKGVDSEQFDPRFKDEDTRNRLSEGEPHKPLIVHVGRLAVEKNLDFFKPLMEKLPGVRLAFVGDGPYRKELEEMFKGKPVVFTGTLEGDELAKAYASGDIFVTASESETLGLVVLEAMSAGVAVVAARARGITDIVPPEGEGKLGFLFAPGNVHECASLIQTLLNSPQLRLQICQAARADVKKRGWRSATTKIRNADYSLATLFWHKKQPRFLTRFFWYLGFPLRWAASLKCLHRFGL